MKTFRLSLLAICMLASTFLTAQVTNNLQQPTSINTDGSVPDASAMLDVQSTTQGMLVPRMTTAQRTGVATPATGLLVFDMDENGFFVFADGQWNAIGLPTGGEWKDFLQIDAAGNAVWQPVLDPADLPNLAPSDIGNLSGLGIALTVAVQGNYAYFPDRDKDSLFVADVSNPDMPTIVGGVLVGDDPFAADVQGDYAYVVNRLSANLVVVNVSDPFNPVISGTVSIGGNPYFVKVEGNYAYVTNITSNELQIIDVSNPGAPALDGAVDFGPTSVPIYVEIDGEYAYVGDNGLDELLIVDIGNPSTPVLTSALATGTVPRGIAKKGNFVYVADDGSDSLKVVNVSNPVNPFITGKVKLGNQARNIAIQGNIAVLTDQDGAGFKVFDISDPANPVLADSLAIGWYGFADVQGNYAYVMQASTGNLKIIRLSDIQQIGVDFTGGIVPYEDLDPDPTNELISGATLNGNTLEITDAGGTTTIDLGSLSTTSNLLEDADMDTKIQVEKNPDEDVIRMDLGGSERFILRKNIPNSRTVFDLPNNAGNVLIGQSAGDSTTTGVHNIFIGQDAGRFNKTGNGNVFLGKGAGQIGQSPFSNIFIGYEAGMNSTSGDNTFIGYHAGKSSTTGGENTFLGSFTGTNHMTGSQNTFLGRYAGQLHETGGSNTFVGRGAGRGNISGGGNVFLGRSAGENETGSNKLYIANSNTATPLIYGEFDNNLVGINGKLGIGTTMPSEKLDVAGTVKATAFVGNGAALTGLTLSDDDNDTKIQVEESTDEDIIRFDVMGDERLRVSPDSSVFTGLLKQNTGGLWLEGATGGTPASGAGTRLMWIPAKGAFRAGTVNSTQWNDSMIGNKSTVMGGENNEASGNRAFIGGGLINVASGQDAFVGGGNSNTILGPSSFIGGGVGNTVSNLRSFIGGGWNNTVSQGTSSILGGIDNVVSGSSSSIIGGTDNDVSSNNSFIGGGHENLASGLYSFIGGGEGQLSRSYAEAVFGTYNTDYMPLSTTIFNAADRLFVIGNGENSSNRSNAVTVLKNGDVGIGTPAPSSKLHLSSTDSVDFLIEADTDNVNEDDQPSLTMKQDAGAVVGQLGFFGGENHFMLKNNFLTGDLLFGTENTERMRIDNVGNVGIGFMSPTAPLQVKASSNTLPTANGIYLFNDVNTAHEHAMIAARVAGSNGGDALLSLDVQGEGGWAIGVDNSDGNRLKIAPNFNNLASGTIMTIQTNGNVGIGTSSPNVMLDVIGSAEVGDGTFDASFYLRHGPTNGLKIQNKDQANFWDIWHQTDSDLGLYVNATLKGEFDETSGAYSNTSDRRLKDNIRPLGTVLPALMQLQSKRYIYKDDPEQEENIGFIAQEVEALFPELVSPPNPDGRSPYYLMDYSGFGVIAVQAIQEQQAIIERQQTEIESLQSQLSEMDDLKQRMARLEASLLSTSSSSLKMTDK